MVELETGQILKLVKLETGQISNWSKFKLVKLVKARAERERGRERERERAERERTPNRVTFFWALFKKLVKLKG
jgi:hypothetical protein